VSINAITQFGTIVPVDQNNVLGQIDVVLNVDPGNQSLSKVALLVDGTEVSSQTFSAAQWAELVAKNAAKAVAAGEELEDAQQQVVLSFNTAGFNATTGMPNCGVAAATTPICLNGPHTITASVTTGGSTTPAATVSRTITTRNLSGFVGTLSTSGATINDGVGYSWRTGSLTINALPVMFGLTAEPFTVTSVAFTNVFFGGCNNFTSGFSNQVGGANFAVAPGTGAPVGPRFGIPTLTGNLWTVTLPNTGQGPGGAPTTGDVAAYEFDAYATCAAPNALGIGESPVIIATASDGNNIALIGWHWWIPQLTLCGSGRFLPGSGLPGQPVRGPSGQPVAAAAGGCRWLRCAGDAVPEHQHHLADHPDQQLGERRVGAQWYRGPRWRQPYSGRYPRVRKWHKPRRLRYAHHLFCPSQGVCRSGRVRVG
jgi:hypothetical protein